MTIEKTYRRFLKKLFDRNQPFPQQEYDYLINALSVSLEYDPVMQQSRIPIRKTPIAMVYYLQLLAGHDTLDTVNFQKILNAIHKQINQNSNLSPNALTQVNSLLSQIASQFKTRVALFSWQEKDLTASERQTLIAYASKYNFEPQSNNQRIQSIIDFSAAMHCLYNGAALDMLQHFDHIENQEKSTAWEYWYYLGLALDLVYQKCEQQGRQQINDYIFLCTEKTFKLLNAIENRNIQEESALVNIMQFRDTSPEHNSEPSSEVHTPDSWHQAIKVLLQQQSLQGTNQNQLIHFTPWPTPADGDCALHALQLTRNKVVE